MRARPTQAAVFTGLLAAGLVLAGCTSSPPETPRVLTSSTTSNSSVSSGPTSSLSASAPASSSAGSVPVSSGPATPISNGGPATSTSQAVSTSVSTSAGDDRAGWLVLAYFSASNTLETAELSDLKESLAIKDPNVTELALVDRDNPDTANGDSGGRTDADTLPGIPEDPKGGTQLIQISDGKGKLLANLPDQNMIDPQVMAQFITAGIKQFPNRKVAFVMDDHGGGWRGAEEDAETGSGVMDLADITKGLKDGLAAAGRDKLEVLGFDDCLMANLDVLTSVGPYAQRVIASADSEPNAGWDWGYLGDVTGADTPDEYSEKAVAAFKKFYTAQKNLPSATLAVFDSAKIPAVNDALDKMVDGLTDTPEMVQTVATTRAASWQYEQATDPALNFNLVDLGNWAAKLKAAGGAVAAKADAVVQAENASITTSYVDLLSPGATGLTVYFPPTGKTTDPDYLDASVTPGWKAFLQAYDAKVAAVPAENPFDTSVALQASAGQGQFDVQAGYLTSQQKNIVDAVGRIGTPLDDGTVAYLIDGPADMKDGAVQAQGIARYVTVTEKGKTFPVAVSGVTALNIPFAYTAPNGTKQNVLVSVLPGDADPTQLEVVQVYGDIANGTPSRTTLDPKGTLSPRYLIGKSDGSSDWQTDTSVSVTADVFNQKYEIPAVPSGKQIVVAVALTMLNGQTYMEQKTVTVQ